MDAQRTSVGLKPMPRPRFGKKLVRLFAAWLIVVLAIGLWQGYVVWLLSGGGGHAF
jgi:hypothetical protein